MLDNISDRDLKFFLKIVGKEVGDRVVQYKMPIEQLCKLDSSFLKAMFSLDDDGVSELRDSLDWAL